MDTVDALLARANLAQYGPAFEEEGYDDVPFLRDIDESSLRVYLTESNVQMQEEHFETLFRCLHAPQGGHDAPEPDKVASNESVVDGSEQGPPPHLPRSAPDCGECIHCLDKPKFGGRGTLKRGCLAKVTGLTVDALPSQVDVSFRTTPYARRSRLPCLPHFRKNDDVSVAVYHPSDHGHEAGYAFHDDKTYRDVAPRSAELRFHISEGSARVVDYEVMQAKIEPCALDLPWDLPWVVVSASNLAVYDGVLKRLVVSGLEPKSEYRFRVRTVGERGARSEGWAMSMTTARTSAARPNTDSAFATPGGGPGKRKLESALPHKGGGSTGGVMLSLDEMKAELRKYKELHDEGLLTLLVLEEKQREIIGLMAPDHGLKAPPDHTPKHARFKPPPRECGKCVNCLDKPRFGGPGTRRRACIGDSDELPSASDARLV